MRKGWKVVAAVVLLIVILLAARGAYRSLTQTGGETAGQAGSGEAGVVSVQTSAGKSEEASGQGVSAEPAGTSAVIQVLDFFCLNGEGKQVNLSDFAGTPVVINFWATWCPPCRGELEDFEVMYEKYGEDVQFMMVDLTDGTQETQEGVEAFVEENGYQFPVFYDTEGRGAMAYGITAIPQTFFVSAGGELRSQYFGAISAENLEKELQALLEK